MATSRSRTHEQRVDEIAAEAAAKIAADSPVEEEVVVTVEELPPGQDPGRWATATLPTDVAPMWSGSLPVPALAFAEAGVAYSQRVFAAQLRYGARMMDAIVTSSNASVPGRR